MSTLLDKVFNLSQDKNEDAITAKLLLLYYLLLFEEKRRETFQTVKHSAKAMKLEINFNNMNGKIQRNLKNSFPVHLMIFIINTFIVTIHS